MPAAAVFPEITILPVPATSQGPAIDAAKGYQTQELGAGFFLVTDNMYQSFFLVYEKGVIVIDAPPSYAVHIPKAVAAVTPLPITHLIYSHGDFDRRACRNNTLRRRSASNQLAGHSYATGQIPSR